MPLRNVVVLFVAAVLSLVCYQRAARNRYVGTLTEAMNIIETHYVDPVDDRELFEGAMEGMLGKLDPYSSYTNPREYKRFQESIDQNFGGVGILVEINPETKRLTVMNPLVGTPAHKAGIKAGDVILKIGEADTKDMPLDQSVSLMRGREGSTVTITIRPAAGGEPKQLTLTRARIPIESVLGDAHLADGAWDFHLQEDRRIGYVRISTFGEQTTEEFQRALESFKQPGQEVQGLIVDLRSNPGGLLHAAKEVCDMFLDDGVIVTTRGRGGITTNTYRAEPGVLVDRQLPVVVLVDRYTASASEIVSACLQDYERAIVCGERTWGKGTVQNMAQLEGGRSAIKLTTATYWRPSGKNIHKKRGATDDADWGVRPDGGFTVELTDDDREKLARQRRERDLAGLRQNSGKPKPETPTEEKPEGEKSDDEATQPEEPLDDPQLRRAIEHLQQQITPGKPAAA
jgi:carboxyl-terminal processing protease